MNREGQRGDRLSIAARVTLKCSIALAGVAFATGARAECSREMLGALAQAYVEAQSTGKPALLPLAAQAPS